MSQQGEGYSYIRFSDSKQRLGDSKRRQVARAEEWCKRRNVKLNTTVFFDPGRSALWGDHRKNPDRHALAAFLQRVEENDIPRGSYLVIESLDRLTREHVRAALMLCLGLIEKGIRIVQLSPVEMVFDQTCDEMALMFMIGQLARGHGESKRKSDMAGDWWKERFSRARATGAFIPGMLPMWLEMRDGAPFLPPERKVILNHIFTLAANGLGCYLIVKHLRAANTPAWGKSGRWQKGYVQKLLSDRRVLGEYQPGLGARKPEGPAIPNYFPVAVPEPLWLRAQAALASRRYQPGRTGSTVNLFTGIMTSPLNGRGFLCHRQKAYAGHRPLITNIAMHEEAAEGCSFPLHHFELAFLSLLSELDPADLLDHDHAGDELAALADQLLQVQEQRRKITQQLLRGDVAALADAARLLQDRERELAALVQAARLKASSPLQEAWSETQGMIRLLAQAQDPHAMRLRLRARLRAIIRSISLVIVPQGRKRLAAWQVYFDGTTESRLYIAVHRGNFCNQARRQPEAVWFWSVRKGAAEQPIDLRTRDHAERVCRFLATVDVNAIFGTAPGRLADDAAPLG